MYEPCVNVQTQALRVKPVAAPGPAVGYRIIVNRTVKPFAADLDGYIQQGTAMHLEPRGPRRS
eukprot:5963385-Prymnesium_polylepis.1